MRFGQPAGRRDPSQAELGHMRRSSPPTGPSCKDFSRDMHRAGRGGPGDGSQRLAVYHGKGTKACSRKHGCRRNLGRALRRAIQTYAIRYRGEHCLTSRSTGPLARIRSPRLPTCALGPWPQNERGGSEAVLHVREDGRWEVDLRERFGSDEERRPPRSRRIPWCFVSRRDPKHPGLRQVLRSSERDFVASRPGSLVARGLSGPRFSWQYPNAASMVSGAL